MASFVARVLSAQESNLDLEVRILPGFRYPNRAAANFYEPGGRARSKCLRGTMLPLHQFSRIHPGVEPGPHHPKWRMLPIHQRIVDDALSLRPRVYKATQLTTEAALQSR